MGIGRVRVIGGAVAVLAMLLPTARAEAQGPPLDSIVAGCERADMTTAWRKVRAAWVGAHEGQVPRDTALRRRLLQLDSADQAVRDPATFVDSVNSAAFRLRLATRDSADQAALREIVAGYGWPTVSLVGKDGAEAAWTIAQHGDAALQKEALRLMKALPSAETLPNDVATMEDRLAMQEGRPQRYGTQLRASPDGKALAFVPIEDAAGVDRRRAQVGLPPLSVYTCVIRQAYGREVLEPAGPSRGHR